MWYIFKPNFFLNYRVSRANLDATHKSPAHISLYTKSLTLLQVEMYFEVAYTMKCKQPTFLTGDCLGASVGNGLALEAWGHARSLRRDLHYKCSRSYILG